MKCYLYFIFTVVLMQACGIKSCDFLFCRYYNNSDDKAINYLDIKDNGTYLHYYKKNSIEFSQEGTWKKAKDENCIIEFKNWKSYNERGKNYEDYEVYLLFINGHYLDNSPDGNSSSSFENQKTN